MKKYCLLLLLPLVLWTCGEDDAPPTPVDNFDRLAMLTHWADNYIIPGYTAFSESANELAVVVAAFTAEPNTATLTTLREKWLDAYLLWQQVSMLEVGRAATLNLRNNMNVYPVDVAGVAANISAGNANLELPSNIDRQGFGALDYLLFGTGDTDTEILEYYTSDAEAANARNYLERVALRLADLANQVLVDWKDDGYRETFVNNNGSSTNAAVDVFTNNFIFYYEKALRAGKVGIPAGVFSGNPLATHVEAPYSAIYSRQLLETALGAFRSFFVGEGFDQEPSGPSYAAYVRELQADADMDLIKDIEDQWDSASQKIATLDSNFGEQVRSDNISLLETYDELQRNVVRLKVDMVQLLGVVITYVDADGD